VRRAVSSRREVAVLAFDSILAIAVRPRLWLTAIGAAASLAPDGWWRRRPHLPVPDDAVLRWRIATAYGSDDASISADDLVVYLEWRRRQRAAR
jgi:hypothetical protein